jgi:hypothetical protein
MNAEHWHGRFESVEVKVNGPYATHVELRINGKLVDYYDEFTLEVSGGAVRFVVRPVILPQHLQPINADGQT